MITIALDAMGGEHAPRAEVEGAVLAARQYGVRIVLVGVESKVRAELNRHTYRGLPIEIANATEVITMEDSPSLAFRKKRDSSVHVGAKMVRAGTGGGNGKRGEYRSGHGHRAIYLWHVAFG